MNESPCAYCCILWSKYRKLKTVGKLNVSFVLNGTTVNDSGECACALLDSDVKGTLHHCDLSKTTFLCLVYILKVFSIVIFPLTLEIWRHDNLMMFTLNRHISSNRPHIIINQSLSQYKNTGRQFYLQKIHLERMKNTINVRTQ